MINKIKHCFFFISITCLLALVLFSLVLALIEIVDTFVKEDKQIFMKLKKY